MFDYFEKLKEEDFNEKLEKIENVFHKNKDIGKYVEAIHNIYLTSYGTTQKELLKNKIIEKIQYVKLKKIKSNQDYLNFISTLEEHRQELSLFKISIPDINEIFN